jgi:hypothetical protein
MADGTLPQGRFGSLFEGTPAYDAALRRKQFTFGFLDDVGALLEPTEAQTEQARTSYEEVAEWLADGPTLEGALIYAHGSTALGTLNRPMGRNEFDVDFMCRARSYGPDLPPAVLKQLVGDRLKARPDYASILIDKPRCWRLDFAGRFHLDITPSILNPECAQGGELVPDRALRRYKASNPIGYRKLFDRRALLTPSARLVKAMDHMARAEVKPYPMPARRKGVLRRTVQFLKAHRDFMFIVEPELGPLSIIITTLAMRAYEICVQRFEYDNEIDLLCDTLRMMPVFIERRIVEGVALHWVDNETTQDENFAEKWNKDPQLELAFRHWHARALADFEAIAQAEGLDQLQKSLGAAIGEGAVKKAAGAQVERVNVARRDSRLGVIAGAGLAVDAVGATAVRANTFFGRPDAA